MSGYEPVLHALCAEPRVARPGATVELVFRTRNLSALPSPAGTVRFMPAAGLEPLGPLDVAVAPVAPGEELVAVLRARVAPGLDDRSELTARAVLELAGGPLGTNACRLVVRSRPRLDGPGSGVAVTALDGEIVRVHATVVNEGDGPARDLRLVVPVPPGCVPLEGEAATQLARARLGAGERAGLAYDARIVAPVGAVRPDGYAVTGRTRCALPVRAALALAPALAVPSVVLAPARRRVGIAVDLRNDGWVDARDVRVRVALPAPLRPLDGSLAVDGVPLDEANGFARVERADAGFADLRDGDGALAVVVARVPARGGVRVELAAHVPAACAGGTIGVMVGEHRVGAPFAAAALSAVRLRVADAPAAVEPGAPFRVVAELANAGDVAEWLTLAASGAHWAPVAPVLVEELAPGAVVPVELVLQAEPGVEDDAPLELTLVASDAQGERARCGLDLVARERAWLVLDEPPARSDAGALYVLRNAGTTTARGVVVRLGAETHPLEPLAPGARATLAVSERAARRGGTVEVAGRDALALPPLDERPPAAVRARLVAPASAVAGAPFAVRAEIAVDDAVETLALRVPPVRGAAYVPGSTALDGRALLDRAHEAPLAGTGLVLRGIPAATCIGVSWSLLAGSALDGDTLALAAELAVDGEPREVAPAEVAVRAREPFAARPAGLPYHVDACALAPGGALVLLPEHAFESELEPEPVPGRASAEPAPTRESPSDRQPAREAESEAASEDASVTFEPAGAFTFALRLDGERLDEIGRLLCGAERDGLVAHALALRAFFPGAVTPAEPELAGALRDARHALRDVFDRLFVKVRIPGFDVGAADLEDPALRRALVRLYERLLDAPLGVPAGTPAAGTATVELERGRVRGVLSSFADAPFGAPAMLRALVALVPTRCAEEPRLAAALARYAQALDGALARCEGAPPGAFDDALAHGGDRVLDDARADLLAALRARTALAA